MHFCTCKVAIAGDLRQIVERTPFNPVSWPEVEILRSLHGDGSVTDVSVIAEFPQTAKDEKERLRLKYGNAILEDIFPGRNPRMEMEAAGAKIKAPPAWKNPLDIEIAGYDVDPTQTEAAAPPPQKSGAKAAANPFAE